MEPVSQVVLRNESRLPDGPLLLVNPPRDTLAHRLHQAGRPVRCSTQDYGDLRWLQAADIEAGFAAVPELDGSEQTVILFLPREKERLAMLLHAIASRMDTGARLWLVGENRGGIKSSPRHLHQRFERVSSLDKARHCGLFEAAEPDQGQPFDLADYILDWSIGFAGHDIQLRSLPGVFAHGRLDRGTELLLETLEPLRPRGRVLDFACGCGVIGLAVLAASPGTELTLLDSSAAAIESSRQSALANRLTATVLPSELQADDRKRYDWIVSNPPFHRGVASDLDIATLFFRQAGTFLSENGRIVIVFNRHLPYFQWLQQLFGQVELLADSTEFVVVQAARPANRS
jgi:16S rRNA (guanine1207-N2)-methyltransferase